MSETDRILTKSEARRLMSLYMDDDSVKEMKAFLWEKLLSKHDWRESFIHFDIYNKINFDKGYLTKLEAVRRDIGSSSMEAVVDILYTMGYGQKRIIYLLFEWGFPLGNRQVVCAYMRRNKSRLSFERQKFMELIDSAKKEVFAQVHDEVLEAERKSVTVYLTHLNLLIQQLEALDPVSLPSKCRSLRKDIEAIEDRLKEVHGITDVRKAMIEVATQKQILEFKGTKGAKSLDDGDSIPAQAMIISGNR